MDIDSDEEVKKEVPRVVYQFDVPQVIALLQNILSGDNAKIKEATKIHKYISKFHFHN